MYLNEWGPIAWELFHFITYTYKENLKIYYILFFNTIFSILPCPHCSQHIKNTLSNNNNLPNLFILNKNKIIDWWIDIHNIVNKATNSKHNFDRKMSDSKYLGENNIKIDHKRILQLLKIIITSKANEKNINKNFIRNIYALAHIYPFNNNSSSEELINYVNNKKLDNNNALEWYTNFENIILSNKIKNINDIVINNNNKINIYENIYLNSYSYIKSKDFGKKIIEKENSIIFSSESNENIFKIKSYRILSNLNLIKIFIKGKSFGSNNCKLKVIINTNKDNRKIQYIEKNEKNLIFELLNLKKDEQLNICISTINNQFGNKYVINFINIIEY